MAVYFFFSQPPRHPSLQHRKTYPIFPPHNKYHVTLLYFILNEITLLKLSSLPIKKITKNEFFTTFTNLSNRTSSNHYTKRMKILSLKEVQVLLKICHRVKGCDITLHKGLQVRTPTTFIHTYGAKALDRVAKLVVALSGGWNRYVERDDDNGKSKTRGAS